MARSLGRRSIVCLFIFLCQVGWAEPGPTAVDVSNFLLHPIAHFQGSEAFFSALDSDEEARANYNKMVEETGALRRAARKGLRFKNALLSEMKKELPDGENGIAQDLAMDPLGTIRKSLEAFRQMNQQKVDVPLRPEQVNSRALLDTINMYGLNSSTTEGNLKPGTAEAQYYNKRRWRLADETERRLNRADEAEVLNQWKDKITSDLEQTRAANLKTLTRLVAHGTGGVQFGNSAVLKGKDIEVLDFEMFSSEYLGETKGNVKGSGIARTMGNWTLRAVKEAFSFGDRTMHRILGYRSFKEALKNLGKKSDLGKDSNALVRISRAKPDGTIEVLFEGTAGALVQGLEKKYAQRKMSVKVGRAVGKIDVSDRIIEEAIHREKALGTLTGEINKNHTEKTELFLARFKKVESKEGLLSPTQKALARSKQEQAPTDGLSSVEWFGHGLMDGHWARRDANAKSTMVFDPEKGPEKHAPMRLIRKGFKAIPNGLRATMMVGMMTSTLGGGTVAALHMMDPTTFQNVSLPVDLSKWLPEREVKETPPLIDLDAKNGAKAKSTTLFEVHALKGKELKDLPIFFHYATKEQLEEARRAHPKDAGIDIPDKTEGGDLRVTSNIPMKATEDTNEITVPTPKDGILKALVVRDRTGKKLTPTKYDEKGEISKRGDYTIRQDAASGVYFVRVFDKYLTYEEVKKATYKVEATFEEAPEKDKNGKEVRKDEKNKNDKNDGTDPTKGMEHMMGGGFMKDATKVEHDDRVMKIPAEKVNPEIAFLRKAGLNAIADEIEKKLNKSHREKKTVMMQQISLAVMEQSVQSEERGIASDEPIDPNDPYKEFKKYVKGGRLHADPNTGNRLLERILKRVFGEDSKIKVARVPVIIREPEKSELNVRNFFVRTVVSVDDGKKKWFVDGVPAIKPEEKKPFYPGKPVHYWSLPPRRASLSGGKEPPKRRVSLEEHEKRLADLESHIQAIHEVLIDDPMKRKSTTYSPKKGSVPKSPPRVPAHIAKQLPSFKAIQAARSVARYAAGEIPVENVYRTLHAAFPEAVRDPDAELRETEVDYEATELDRPFEEDLGKTVEKVGKEIDAEIKRKADFVMKSRQKGPFAIHASPEYQTVVSNLMKFVARTDWTPVSRPEQPLTGQPVESTLCNGFKKVVAHALTK